MRFAYGQEDIARLVDESLSSEEMEKVMAELQRRLREGDKPLAASLYDAIQNKDLEPESRSLALETLAGARAALFMPLVVLGVTGALKSKHESLRFTGVACAPEAGKADVIGLIKDLAADSEPSADCRRAARELLKFWDEEETHDETPKT